MSSILEKLMILIQLDASGMKQGAEQVQSSSAQIDRSLEHTAKHANFLDHVFGHLRRELIGFTVATIGFGAALQGIRGSFDYYNKIGDASDKLQVNVELLDAWNEAVIKAGGTAESFDESIKHVAEHFHASNATILKVLPQFADLFHHLNNSQAQAYGKKLGFDESTIQLLQKGGKEVDAIIAKQKELGLVTKEQKEIMDKYNDSWNVAKQQFRYAAFEAELTLIPALTKVITFLGDTVGYFSKHPTFVKSFIFSFVAMGIAAKVFGSTVKKEGKEAALGWAELLGPMALVAGAIALIIDDWKGFKRGDDSVTGQIMERWPKIGRVIVSVGNEVGKAMDDWINKAEYFLTIFSKILSLKGNAPNASDEQSKIIHSWFNLSPKSTIPSIALAKNTLSEISNHPINSYIPGLSNLNSGSAMQKNVNIRVGNITINTQATDAQAISSAIGKGLYDHLFQVQAQLDDGQLA